MQLTRFSDYSLRVLIYLGHKQGPATVKDISQGFNVSRNHLVKVVHRLAQLGLIHTTKGFKGGISLAKEPSKYRIGEVVSLMEPHMELVECFNPTTNTCPIIGVCDLERILIHERNQLIANLNKYSLQDLLVTKNAKEKMARLKLSKATP